MQILTSTLFEEKKNVLQRCAAFVFFGLNMKKKRHTHEARAGKRTYRTRWRLQTHNSPHVFFFFFFVRWIVAVVIRFTLLSQRLLSVIRRSSAIADTLLADVIPSTSFPGMLFFLNGSKRTNGFDLT